MHGISISIPIPLYLQYNPTPVHTFHTVIGCAQFEHPPIIFSCQASSASVLHIPACHAPPSSLHASLNPQSWLLGVRHPLSIELFISTTLLRYNYSSSCLACFHITSSAQVLTVGYTKHTIVLHTARCLYTIGNLSHSHYMTLASFGLSPGSVAAAAGCCLDLHFFLLHLSFQGLHLHSTSYHPNHSSFSSLLLLQ